MTHPKVAEVVAGNVRRLREEGGWTQAQLATVLRAAGLTGCTGTQVGKVENGQMRADHLGLIAAYCKAFQEPVTTFLEGDGHAVIAHEVTMSLHDIRLALIGVLPPADDAPIPVQIMDEYNIERIAELAGLEDAGVLRLVSITLFDRANILEWRDQRAGIGIRPGTRDEIRARRARATKVIVAEIKDAVATFGVDTLVEQGMDRLRQFAGEDG